MQQDLSAVQQNLAAVQQNLAAVQQGMREDLAAVEQRMGAALGAVEQRIDAFEHQFRDEMLEAMRHIETSMLTAFHGYAKGNAARLVKIEASDVSADLRLNAIEDRVLALETRRSA